MWRPRARFGRLRVTTGKRMIERIEQRFALYPERLAGDAAYGSGEMLGWLVHERGIEPHVPVFRSPRDGASPLIDRGSAEEQDVAAEAIRGVSVGMQMPGEE